MKKLILLYLLFLASSATQCNFISNAWDSVKNIGEDTINTLENEAKNIANKVKDAGEDLGNLFKSCGEVVGLGTAYTVATGALKTAQVTLQGSEIIGEKAGLDSAAAALEAALKASQGTMNLVNALAQNSLDITCFRLLGQIPSIQFELQGTIFGNKFNITEKVDFTDAKSLAKQIFESLKNVIT